MFLAKDNLFSLIFLSNFQPSTKNGMVSWFEFSIVIISLALIYFFFEVCSELTRGNKLKLLKLRGVKPDHPELLKMEKAMFKQSRLNRVNRKTFGLMALKREVEIQQVLVVDDKIMTTISVNGTVYNYVIKHKPCIITDYNGKVSVDLHKSVWNSRQWRCARR